MKETDPNCLCNLDPLLCSAWCLVSVCQFQKPLPSRLYLRKGWGLYQVNNPG